MLLYGGLQLPNILGSTLSKGGLRLPVPLFSLLRGCIDLRNMSVGESRSNCLRWTQRTGFRPPLRFWTSVGSCVRLCSSGSGEDPENDSSSNGSILGTAGRSSILDMPTKCTTKPDWA